MKRLGSEKEDRRDAEHKRGFEREDKEEVDGRKTGTLRGRKEERSEVWSEGK